MTPQQAYEKRYANIDDGQHTWDAAPEHVKEMWLAAWTIAWALATSYEREACAQLAEKPYMRHVLSRAIRARGEG